jgi:hypothetical protein
MSAHGELLGAAAHLAHRLVAATALAHEPSMFANELKQLRVLP